MSYVTEDFQAYLSKPLEAADVYLPVSHAAYADLLKLLAPECSYTYLTIRDDTHAETVKAYAAGSYIILDRAQAGTTAQKFSYGACVTTVSPTVAAAANAQLENVTSWYWNPDAMMTPLGIEQVSLPLAHVGTPYVGWIFLNGALPMDINISGAASWMNIEEADNMLEISGVPNLAEVITLDIQVTNCGGAASIHETVTLTVN